MKQPGPLAAGAWCASELHARSCMNATRVQQGDADACTALRSPYTIIV